MSKNSVSKAGIGYTIGNILIKAISFVTLPIFTRLMSTGEYGLYSTYISYESILALLVSMGLYGSLKMANIEYRGRVDQYVSSISLLPIIATGAISVIILIFIDNILNFTNFPLIVIISMTLNALASSFINLYNTRISLDYAYKKYLYMSFLIVLGNVSLSLLLITTVFKDDAFTGRVIGTVIPISLIAGYIWVVFTKKAPPTFNKEYYRFGLKYSLPLVPHGVSQIILAQFGKIVIQRVVGNTAAGIYGFAYTIVLIPQVLFQSFDTAWGPWFFDQYDRKNYEVIKKKSTTIVILFSVIILCFCSVSPELINLLGDQSYWDSKTIVIPAILGTYFAFLYMLPAQIEYFHKKTKYIAIGTLVAAVFNVIGCIILIPMYGYQSAVYVTLLTYILYFGAHLFIAYRLQHTNFPFNIWGIFVCVVCTCISCFLLQFLVPYWILRYTLLGIVLAILCFFYHNNLASLIYTIKK